jgi:hypothetical protein
VSWRSVPTIGKGKLMPMTKEHFYKVIGMRDELIFEQEKKISKLKIKINKLEQKLNKEDR